MPYECRHSFSKIWLLIWELSLTPTKAYFITFISFVALSILAPYMHLPSSTQAVSGTFMSTLVYRCHRKRLLSISKLRRLKGCLERQIDPSKGKFQNRSIQNPQISKKGNCVIMWQLVEWEAISTTTTKT